MALLRWQGLKEPQPGNSRYSSQATFHVVKIVYTKQMHKLILSGISCHCYDIFVRQNDKRNKIIYQRNRTGYTLQADNRTSGYCFTSQVQTPSSVVKWFTSLQLYHRELELAALNWATECNFNHGNFNFTRHQLDPLPSIGQNIAAKIG